MRRFPHSWDTLRTKLGFRKVKNRRKADRRHRSSRIEPLEVRALLSSDPIATLDDDTVLVGDASFITIVATTSEPTFVLTNETPVDPDQLAELQEGDELPAYFLVETLQTKAGPKALVSLNPVYADHAPAGVQTLKLDLQIDGQVLESYEILIDVAEARFREQFLSDRIDSIQASDESLTAERLLELNLLEQSTVSEELVTQAEMLIEMIGPKTLEQQALIQDYLDGTADSGPANLASAKAGELRWVVGQSRQTNALDTPASVVVPGKLRNVLGDSTDRTALYAEIETRLEQVLQDRAVAATDAEQQAVAAREKTLQDTGLLLAAQIAQDLQSEDVEVKAAAQQLRAQLVAHGDTYHTLFTGLGIDREVERSTNGSGDIKAFGFVETGTYQFSDALEIDLAGQQAMVQVTQKSTSRVAPLISVSESPAVLDGFIYEDAPTTVYGSSTSLAISNDTDVDRESLLRFDLSQVADLSNPVPITDASLKLTELSGSGAVDVYVWNSVLPGGTGSPSDWDETNLTWDRAHTTLDLDSKLSEFTLAGTWQGGTTTSIDVSSQLQRALLYGDANGDGEFDPTGAAGDIEAFHLAAVDWDAYVAEYGPRAANSADLLARNDGGLGDGVIDSGDVDSFLSRYGLSRADFNQDGVVDGSDWSAYQAGYLDTSNVRFAQGDADFDGDVNSDDFDIWDAEQQAGTTYTAKSPELMVWLRPTGSSTNLSFAAQEHTTSNGPTLEINESPDLVINDFTVDDGLLRMDYAVLGETFSNVTVQIFKTGDATPLYTSAIQSGTLGAHSLTISTSYLSSVVEGDSIYAVVSGTPDSGTEANTTNNQLDFEFTTDSQQIVNSLDDGGMDTLLRDKYTLRELLEADAALGWYDTISFAPETADGVIRLAGEELLVGDDVTIEGPGSSFLAIDANSLSRVFNIDTGVEAAISGLTALHGDSNGGSGGAIVNKGNLTLGFVSVLASYAPLYGGGISSSSGSSLSLEYSTVDSNIARYGAGIYIYSANGGDSEIAGSTISNNTDDMSDGAGGGLFIKGASDTAVPEGSVLITSSTFSGNSVDKYGAGLRQQYQNPQTVVVNSTFTENSSGLKGGGLSSVSGGSIRLENTIVAANLAPTYPDLEGTFSSSSSYNLIGIKDGNQSIYNDVDGNLVGTAASPIDPRLAPLNYYGGPTRTHLVLSDSLAVDAGSDDIAETYGLLIDQRGFDRFYDVVGVNDSAGNQTDIGAYEDPEFTVNSDKDYGAQGKGELRELTLRAALNAAKQEAGGTATPTITFADSLFEQGSVEIILHDTAFADGGDPNPYPDQLVIDFSVDIVGPGADKLTVRGTDEDSNASSRVFYVYDDQNDPSEVEVNISGLGITSGGGYGDGGGIYLGYATLSLDQVRVFDNWAYNGGGISNYAGDLTVTRSEISDNWAYWGGGISHTTNSSNGDGSLTLENTTISGNLADPLPSNTTLGSEGGGVYGLANTTILNTTIVDNTARDGGGVFDSHASVPTIENTIITKNWDFSPTQNDSGGNWTPNSAYNHNLMGNLLPNPRLAPLGYYGGPTQTHALLPGSLLIDAGNSSIATEFDQRGEGYSRTLNGMPDIGAVESHVAMDSSGNVTIWGTDNDDIIRIEDEGVVVNSLGNLNPIDVSGAATITVNAEGGDDRVFGGSYAVTIDGGAGEILQ